MENESAIAAYFLSPEWMIILSIAAYFLIRKPFQTIFGTPNVKKDFRNGLVVLIQLLIVSFALDFISRVLGVNDTQSVDAFAQTIFALGIGGVFTILVSALAEEVFFRGILFSILGGIPTIILFGLAHAGYGSAIEVAGALAAGYIFIRARSTYQSIFPGLIGHALYNLAVVFVFSQY